MGENCWIAEAQLGPKMTITELEMKAWTTARRPQPRQTPELLRNCSYAILETTTEWLMTSVQNPTGRVVSVSKSAGWEGLFQEMADGTYGLIITEADLDQLLE